MPRVKQIVVSAFAVALVLAASPVLADGVFYIVDGKAGVGTSNPASDLHVSSTDGDGQLYVQEKSGTNARRTLLRMVNNGPSQFTLYDGTTTWIFGQRGTGFEINKGGSGSTQFLVKANGDGLFDGNVFAKGVKLTSSRTKKQEFQTIDSKAILEKVVALPISEWSFKRDSAGVRHIGPMAEDFHAAFGVGEDNTTIGVTDANGVTLAAVQGLHLELREKESELEQLNDRVQQLEQLVESLAERVN